MARRNPLRLLSAALVLAASGSLAPLLTPMTPAVAVENTLVTITVHRDAFSPAMVEIVAGDEVDFVEGPDIAPHTITSDASTCPLNPGRPCWPERQIDGQNPVAKFRFPIAGTYRYYDRYYDHRHGYEYRPARHEEYRRWLQMSRAAPGPGNLRRPLWMIRVYRPAPEAFYFPRE